MSERPVLAVIGGTGAQGGGLALRWAAAGYPVIVGSRSEARAAEAAAALGARAGATIRGLANEAAAAAAEVVVLTVPWAAHADTLAAIRASVAGKMLIDVTVPIVPPRISVAHVPPDGSAAKSAQRLLGGGARVVAAFQNVAAHLLDDLHYEIDCDVLVCGDDAAAKEAACALARDAGFRALDAGPLANAVAVESLTAVLITLNRRYRVRGAGLRITGLAEDAL